MARESALPSLPVPLEQLLPYIAEKETFPATELFQPFRDYDSKVRELYAQAPDTVGDGITNAVSLFDGPGLKTRARDIAAESSQEKDRYIMPLTDENRHASDTPATVLTIKEFKHNFSIFTEMCLSDMDWANVVVGGSAALTPLLPLPEKAKESKRALRQYYHEELAPASDIDLFLYGLTEEEAKEKIKQIEAKIRDSILQEVTCIRTKNAITIASQHPNRHVQIVLRTYKDISEILTGFDVDCSCVAYDGEKVWAAPRAIQALMTQCNRVDLSRRSPSYENRLSKYSRRGFEVYFADLDRSRIDPTIFERSFMRTVGLARLLVLEKLPGQFDRDQYANLRRKERGRPEMNLWRRNMHKMKGNIKENFDDEIADWWVDEEDVSSYHTFTIPYGPRFNAKAIEKLLYTKDLLLNSEWNKPKDREVNLHRHPAFFGYADDVFRDCCEHCPKPVTDDEFETAEHEDKIYVKGEISFLMDNPGRQAIGSFNPITDTDWTEMAYVANTARLCQAIVDGDLEHVQDWLEQEEADANKRDHTGRTPLQLAVLCSTPEIVQALIDADARIVARLANGYTALHLAAERGDVAIIKSILNRSERNEAEHEEREDLKKAERKKAREVEQADSGLDDTKVDAQGGTSADGVSADKGADNDDDNEGEDEDWEGSEADSTSMATESFVKVKEADKVEALPEDNEDEPDFYDVNVTSWDLACTPLHLAILNGHTDAVKALVDEFGADPLLPVKLLNDYDKSPRAAILTLVLALTLPQEQAQAMAKALLDSGATNRQADLNGVSVIQYYVNDGADALEFMLEHDRANATSALSHIAVSRNIWNPETKSALLTAISNSDTITCLKVLEHGASPDIPFPEWIKQAKSSFDDSSRTRLSNDPDYATSLYRRSVEQPIVVALGNDAPDVALALLKKGADPNSLTKASAEILSDSSCYRTGLSLLDIVRMKLGKLSKYEGEVTDNDGAPIPLKPDEEYLSDFSVGSYKHWAASLNLELGKETYQQHLETYEKTTRMSTEGVEEKKEAVRKSRDDLRKLETELLQRGAKTFKELHPNVGNQDLSQDTPFRHYREISKPFELTFKFLVGELHEALRDRYLQLFEAAWTGDLETIKKLTLEPSGKEAPLKIAVQDNLFASPFNIAVMRGHTEVAEAILEICAAQYSPPKKTEGETRYSMEERDEDGHDSYDSESHEDQVRVFQRIVDDTFTRENIGEISLQVESHVKPLEYLDQACPNKLVVDGKESEVSLNSSSLLGYAITTDNYELFTWLLDLGERYSVLRTESGMTPVGTFYNVSIHQLRLAIEFGRTKMLGELLRRTGCGIPLDDLVSKSGVADSEKPQYYQGLSVYGKKRTDWAAAGRRTQVAQISSGSRLPPLLMAAKSGTLESLEYLLSDTPIRLYHEFINSNKNDKRVKRLGQGDGASEKAIEDWYYAYEESLLPSAVAASPSADADRKLEYLVKAYPRSVDAKCTKEGETPLQLAFKLGRHSSAKILLSAGADPSTRDKAASNLLHKLLENFNPDDTLKVDKLLAMIELLDQKTLQKLFTQRNTVASFGGTPLHIWQHLFVENARNYYSWHAQVESEDEKQAARAEVLKTLIALSGDKALYLTNSAGNTLLHSLIAARKIPMIKLLVEHDPQLLFRESAIGQTPLEQAHALYTAQVLKDPPRLNTVQLSSDLFGYNNDAVRAISDNDPNTFVKKTEDKRSDEEKIWQLCRDVAKQHAGTRRLVSLSEANEVARRVGDLAAQSKTETRYSRLAARGYRFGDDVAEEEDNDFVAEWVEEATAWET